MVTTEFAAPIKHMVDTVSLTTIVATFVGWLPHIAALLSVVWIGGIYSVFPTRLRNLMPLAIVSVFTYLNIMNFDCYARTYHKFNIVATNSVSCGGSYVPVTGIYSD